LRFNNLKFISPEAFSEGYIINDFFQTYITNSDFFYVNDFDSLKYPFRAVATDLVSGQSIAIKSGNLSKAIRASSTLPITYAPVKIDDMILVDGGIMANLPVRFAKEYIKNQSNSNNNSNYIIIACDATTPIYQPDMLKTPIIIADQVLTISMNHFVNADAMLADILIRPNFNDIDNINASATSYLDFSDVKKYIDLGYTATMDGLIPVMQSLIECHTELVSVSPDNNEETQKQVRGNIKKTQKTLPKTKNSLVKRNKKMVLGNEKMVLGNEKMILGNEKMILGNEKMVLGNEKMILGNEKMILGNEKIDFGNKIIDFGDILDNINIFEDVRNIFKDAVFVFNYEEDAVIIDNIEVVINNEKVNDYQKIITQHFPIHIGDTLSNKKLAECYDFLENNATYKEVSIQLVENKNYTMLVEIIEEGNQTLRFTGNFDNERWVHIGIDFLTKNIWTKNNNVNLTLGISNINKYVGVSLFNSQIFGTPIAFNFNIYYDWKDILVYEKHQIEHTFNYEILDTNFIKKRGFQIGFGASIERNGLVNVTYRLENQAFGRLIDAPTNNKNNNVSLFGLALKYDTEEAPFFPKEGSVIDASVETNLFSITEYTKFSKILAFMKTNFSSGDHTLSPSLFF
jgi:NTE family protein